ncbi:Nucleotidyl transferase AbiEii toxin, Type IV TA system [Promicromonospora umidemergens]|uniref:Nucleotidyl transferase AbiEii/AbiGii toxin family protein n=1 Tax=Promicromonospora umidemergens TaxID=629679 RepID=A0ABP8X5A5_9MICO|nr:nucleotidyl transferase AbiEii/AbiGii toxin family protein [Promicromonospora umidemergens]MCP2285060.1 Nucleotidyl transferase AbiEii toxin, Type IV TA system [Promicromonospora umidemergens]
MTEIATATTAGQAREAYLALRNVARRDGVNFAETLVLYKLERTLHRLTRTDYRHKSVLKGGFLLAAYADRRPTKDIDAMLSDLSLDEATVRQVCRAVIAVDEPDRLTYDVETLNVTEIRENDDYAGFRAAMTCNLHTDRQKIAFDFSTGDPVAPPAIDVVLPGLLGQDVTVRGYVPAMIVAEKYVTALARGETNTRWRDFVDLYTIGRTVPVDPSELLTSLRAVANHRGVPLVPLAEAVDLTKFAEVAQTRYVAWRRKHGLSRLAPERFADLLAAVGALIDPVLAR